MTLSAGPGAISLSGAAMPFHADGDGKLMSDGLLAEFSSVVDADAAQQTLKALVADWPDLSVQTCARHQSATLT